ncbi:MAG: hypothetical protein PUI48_04250 [Oscillospiraceae bacterium]|nr:hypothetical protein [Oscillospiraceae bacterium]MDY6208762.1 hypothetical protein [Oscillospiraceae bacterium]
MKKYFSVIAAAVIAASMAVSVSAADYSGNPGYVLPPAAPSAPAGSNGSVPAAGTSLSNPFEVIEKKDIRAAVAKGEPVYASYETAQLKANAMAMLAGKDGGVLTVVTKRYTAVIDGDSITEAKDISLAIKMTKAVEQGAMVLRTEQKGSFGCTVDIHISAKYYTQCGVDLKNAHVYYVDGDKNVNDMGALVFDDDGNIVVSMTDGGKYIIM